jgi:hypothetical protein
VQCSIVNAAWADRLHRRGQKLGRLKFQIGGEVAGLDLPRLRMIRKLMPAAQVQCLKIQRNRRDWHASFHYLTI